MTTSNGPYPRDMVGYGANPPDPKWPGGANICLTVALNYEAGGEMNILHGDARSESMLTDTGFPAYDDARNVITETAFEYGSRRGIWRILRILDERGIKVSAWAVVMGLERNPQAACAIVEGGHEMVSHGWRWIDYQCVPEEVEREHIQRAIEGLRSLTGERPVGWMTGRPGPNTRRLLVEEGGFLYDRDSLADELPYWVEVESKPHLVIPISYETNDNRFNEQTGFVTADDFFTYMKDAFDVLYGEGERGEPKMMMLALHDRIIGRPARAVGLERFLDYVLEHDKVWIARGVDIARHWMEHHPYRA
ncbi:MAG: polysaccharide deacetylase family protein [Rhodospirillales bacterium]|nr:polysaccharide deacetylase family protein [Rhodospirillales bacterium]